MKDTGGCLVTPVRSTGRCKVQNRCHVHSAASSGIVWLMPSILQLMPGLLIPNCVLASTAKHSCYCTSSGVTVEWLWSSFCTRVRKGQCSRVATSACVCLWSGLHAAMSAAVTGRTHDGAATCAGTTGIMGVCRDDWAMVHLGEQFRSRQVCIRLGIAMRTDAECCCAA
jgi:hypothetical protein